MLLLSILFSFIRSGAAHVERTNFAAELELDIEVSVSIVNVYATRWQIVEMDPMKLAAKTNGDSDVDPTPFAAKTIGNVLVYSFHSALIKIVYIS